MKTEPRLNASTPPEPSGTFESVSNCLAPALSDCAQLRGMLVETMNEPLIMLDEHQVICYANRAFYEMTGFTPPEILGKQPYSLLLKRHHDLLRRQMLLLSKGRKACFEVELPIKNGSLVHLLVSASPFPSEHGAFRGAFAVLTDVTEQKRINDAVLAAKLEWERTFDAVQDYLCVVDRNNTIKRVNASLAEYFEVHPRELIGKRCDDLFDFCLPPLARTQDFSLLAEEKALEREVYSYTMGGFFQVSVYPFDDPPHDIQGLVYVVRNVKAQKQLESLLRDAHKQVEEQVRQRTQDLRQANKDLVAHIQEKDLARKELTRLAAIIEQVAESVVLTDTNWIISYVNPAFSRMTGIRMEQAVSEKMNLLSFIQHSALALINMDELMRGKGIWHGLFTKYREDGSRYDVKVQISPLKDQGGQIINYVAMFNDVTLETRMERRIRNSEKMEAIGIFAAGIAHDFNNILGGIIGAIELAEDQLGDDDPLRADLQDALMYSDNARNLIRQILTFKRQDSLAAYPLSALAVVQEAVAVSRGLMPEGIRIVQKLQPTNWLLLSNSTHIQQILMNLCSNAAHAMDKQGDIEVTLSEKTLRTPLAVHDNHLPPGEYIHLTVKDTGHGIAQDILEHIFEPLFSTKKNSGGTGMGLSIVNAVMHRLGGGMLLDSQQGRGTTIHLYLPRCVPLEEVDQCRAGCNS